MLTGRQPNQGAERGPPSPRTLYAFVGAAIGEALKAHYAAPQRSSQRLQALLQRLDEARERYDNAPR